ncbi:MAG TPA: hypothetical protein VFX31_09155 [Ktedonobacterales bacterium]|jgi:hypothetical protein|nr:hypothetical protein [Ktedonobacterales bacterium]HEX5571542.1 hypothetical protein [Ktedonobacterales bacterium]
MLYQVLTRASAQATWEPFQAMTRDPLQAIALLRQAAAAFAEVSVIQAESAALLREQARRLRANEPTGHERCPLPSLTATPRISLAPVGAESQRWALEQGPGGDHDQPYHFVAPISEQTLTRWAQLMSAARERLDGSAGPATDASETLAALAALADEAAATAPSVSAASDSSDESNQSEALPPERIG